MLPLPSKQFRPGFPYRRAFSLVELLVVLGILIILCSIFIPYVGKMRETNKRVGCADNLRQIHAAFSKYAAAYDRDFPRMPRDPQRAGAYVAFTGATVVPPPLNVAGPAVPPAPSTTAPAATPGSPSPVPAPPSTNPAVPPSALTPPEVAATQPTTSPVAAVPTTGPATAPRIANPGNDALQPNDVTAALWLLVRLGYVQPNAFVCSSASETVDPMLTAGKRVAVDQRSNFTSGQHLSYSYCSPYSAAPRFRLNSDVLPPDFAIMADKNPGISGGDDNVVAPRYDEAQPLALSVANSRNHNRAGQNVLYVTGEVRFQSTPYCGYGNGWKRDNIYTAHAAQPLPQGSNPPPEVNGVVSPNVGPAWENDSYLVPTDDE